MQNIKFLLLSAIFLLGIAAIVSLLSKSTSAQSLVGAPVEKIEQEAVDYTYKRFKVLSGFPTILLTKPVTKDELPSLGLSAIGFGGEEPPLMLVALKGDFDVSNIRGSVSTTLRVKYLVYVFDLKAGMPTLIQYSADGSHFRKLLNDPNLPEEPPTPDRSGEPKPDNPPMTPAPTMPYGSVAPAVTPESTTMPEESTTP